MAEVDLTGSWLVVSDDPQVGEAIRFGLPADVEIVVVNDGRSAITTLDSLTPRVVVVDLQTGNAGGFALAKDMAQTARLGSVPVILLLERDQDRWLAEQAGATVALRKPVTGSEVLVAVSSVLAA